jgi:hypothetical protein
MGKGNMKKKLLIGFACGFLLSGAAVSAEARSVPLVNAGFKTGDFTRWYLENTVSEVQGRSDEFIAYNLQEDKYFSILEDGEQAVSSMLSEKIVSNDGESIFEMAALNSKDTSLFHEFADVKIMNAETGNIIAIPWIENSFKSDVFWDGPWAKWVATASNAGKHFVQYEIANMEGSYLNSFGPFDAVSVNQPIPEPATMILLGAGLIGLAGIRIRRKKK